MSSLASIRAVTSDTKPPADHGAAFAEVVPGFFIAHSSQVLASDSLARVTTSQPIGLVVNAATEKVPSRPGYYGGDVDVLPVTVLDTPEADAKQHFREVADRIDATLACGRSAVVHCAASVSRGPTFAIAYLMKSKGLSALEATKLLKEKWDPTWPSDAFVRQLLDFEDELTAERGVASV